MKNISQILRAKCFIYVLTLSSLFMAPVQAAVWNITYPRPIDESDLRHEYPVELLKLALEKTGVRYTLSTSERIMLGGRAMRQLRENRGVNVVWSVTDLQRERDLLPIRIPIAKGLIGLRVLLIREDSQSEFNQIQSLKSLLGFKAIQGEDWPDTKILQANGFNVTTITQFKDGFDALMMRQGDMFPRSVVEVENELAIQGLDPEIQLEKRFALYYPTAMYFFVNKSNPTLGRLIETGLKMALEDGSYEALFQQAYANTLSILDIDNRVIYSLENPLLSSDTPLEEKAYWYVPNMASNNTNPLR